jgi:hypothetical protein
MKSEKKIIFIAEEMAVVVKEVARALTTLLVGGKNLK